LVRVQFSKSGLLLAILAASAAAANSQPAISSPGILADREHFLLSARIESVAPVEKGLTHTKKAMLSDGSRMHAAQIQAVDIYTALFKGKDGSQERDFKDSWKFNVAAYRLAKLLHLTYMVPVSVARPFDGKPAAFTWWIDDVAMDERERVSKGIQPPDIPRWNEQMDTIRIFDQLIYNMDRSQENLLIATDWNVWMIDHTRAFRKWKTLRNPAAITHCNPDLLHWLKALRRPDVAEAMGDLLTPEEIDGLMARRDLIVQKLEGQELP
jgi:hypothetical protein